MHVLCFGALIAQYHTSHFETIFSPAFFLRMLVFVADYLHENMVSNYDLLSGSFRAHCMASAPIVIETPGESLSAVF